ncbi:MAG: DUF4830 domain-containing protein [Clostridia bacterium]|nr:DUF4830 domain-containing protein [Clostridia bacterium]
MKEFVKENLIQILLLIFASLLLIFGGQVLKGEFFKTANFENLEDINDRVRCAKSLGWYVDKTSETKRSVYIPNEETEEFNEYNEMQKMCGFDLVPYMGKGAHLYTYRILNFPSDTSVNAFLNLIIYDGKMIGGDCDVLEYDDLYLPVKRAKCEY